MRTASSNSCWYGLGGAPGEPPNISATSPWAGGVGGEGGSSLGLVRSLGPRIPARAPNDPSPKNPAAAALTLWDLFSSGVSVGLRNISISPWSSSVPAPPTPVATPAFATRFANPRVFDPTRWTPVQHVYHVYHHPDYFCPEPYEAYPSHLHIDLLPRAQGRGHGRRMIEQMMGMLRRRGSPGAHLGVSMLNSRAQAFYSHLGFRELARAGSGPDECLYMGIALSA